ncbi:MAG: ligase-associated DNA damage response DEXH box helicase [Hyphomicrobiaceae bacterium]|nr:ligase-associated DNA damage response DEXH box helicase [Hyphomicrobiaceae bacterium]
MQHSVCLPVPIQKWFFSRGWEPRPHQLKLLAQGRARRSSLLIAPTGAGKTFAGFLPTLDDLISIPERKRQGAGLHTLYISPLKALAVDIERNLKIPLREMQLPITVETRSGDTSPAKRQRQRIHPPDVLLTTPEQLALLLSNEDGSYIFTDLKNVIIDELHALTGSKRGDLLALGLARLRTIAVDLLTIGLSATVARPTELRAYLMQQRYPQQQTDIADLVYLQSEIKPDISILETEKSLPWSGHTSRYAIPDIYRALKQHRLTLIFVNTRSQAELIFQELWYANEAHLPIALHHGSLDSQKRRKVETAMAEGRLKAVVCTSTLDLGIDWGNIDLVINIGAPKGASRLIQRVGRANHRLDEPSKAILVPANRFEVLECRAAVDAVRAGMQDNILTHAGTLDVLAQHIMSTACAGPFATNDLYNEICSAQPYSYLTKKMFERVLNFVTTGGYALRAYERFARLKPTKNGLLRLAHPRLAKQHRLNIGTIVNSPMVKIRMTHSHKKKSSARDRSLSGGRVLGEMEEYFIGELKIGDAFIFAGQVLRFEGMRETDAYVSNAASDDPLIPSYRGGKFPLSSHLASRVRIILANGGLNNDLPTSVQEWLQLQHKKSILPGPNEVLVETFSRQRRSYIVAYPFEGRLTHQTLGMLLTRRLQRANAQPLGFVATDYALSIWCAKDIGAMLKTGRLDVEKLFNEDMLGDDLEAWLAESSLMKRTFRMCAVIAGLIECYHPGKTKTGRQMTASSDLMFDMLCKYDPNHILLEAAWNDAVTGLLDIGRLGDFLKRIKTQIRHINLNKVSPLSVPILLEIGQERVQLSQPDDLLRSIALELIAEAGLD